MRNGSRTGGTARTQKLARCPTAPAGGGGGGPGRGGALAGWRGEAISITVTAGCWLSATSRCAVTWIFWKAIASTASAPFWRGLAFPWRLAASGKRTQREKYFSRRVSTRSLTIVTASICGNCSNNPPRHWAARTKPPVPDQARGDSVAGSPGILRSRAAHLRQRESTVPMLALDDGHHPAGGTRRGFAEAG